MNVEYIGSPLQLSFGEAFQEKHLIIFDQDKKECEYILNDFSPKHLIIKSEDTVTFALIVGVYEYHLDKLDEEQEVLILV